VCFVLCSIIAIDNEEDLLVKGECHEFRIAACGLQKYTNCIVIPHNIFNRYFRSFHCNVQYNTVNIMWFRHHMPVFANSTKKKKGATLRCCSAVCPLRSYKRSLTKSINNPKCVPDLDYDSLNTVSVRVQSNFRTMRKNLGALVQCTSRCLAHQKKKKFCYFTSAIDKA
jgi:hypothetical protein